MGKRIGLAGAALLGVILAAGSMGEPFFALPEIPALVVSARESGAKKTGFAEIEVIDGGEKLPDNQKYTGLVCNIRDTYSENVEVKQSDGSLKEEELFTMRMNNICVSVPDGGIRSFGIPIFMTRVYTEGEADAREKWDNVVGEDCPEFADMETARELIREGYFQKPLEEFLSNYPEIRPQEREYRLIFTGGGRTDRAYDGTSWWDLNYKLVAQSDGGEQVTVVTIDITKVIRAQGQEIEDDAHYRIWSVVSGLWQLQEDPAEDLGETWISQVQGQDFSDEEQVRAYVEEVGADFDLLLPAGVDREVEWECSQKTGNYYNYLVWTGTTDLYEVTLAIPLMDENGGGWYMASRIRKESQKKEICRHTLSVMMETFQEDSNVHIVKKGENMWQIYKEQGRGNSWQYDFESFIEYNNLKNPDLIYPDQRIRIP